MHSKFQTLHLILPPESAGLRLDQALAQALPQYSRARLQRFLAAGQVNLEGADAIALRASQRVTGGEQLTVRADIEIDTRTQAEDIALDIVHEDADLLVINKPAGLVVHPGAGNASGTLQNALLGHDPALAGVPRAGLVHRIDKDTSGLLVVARNLEAHRDLVAQLAAHEIGREYLAVCRGHPAVAGTIDRPLGRHRRLRTRFAVRADGRDAVTHYRVLERFRAHSLLELELETGRTHQIRVHLEHLGFPIVGDPQYGARRHAVAGIGESLRGQLAAFPRQALHARRLQLRHPSTGRLRTFSAPLPADMQRLLRALRADARRSEARRDGARRA